MRVVALVATIPARSRSCTRVLAELAQQSRPPDVIALALDGYGEAPAPVSSLPVVATRRTPTLTGPGGRWRLASELSLTDIVICVDDDVMLAEAPRFIAALAGAIEGGADAAAAMGRGTDGKSAPPGSSSRGALIHAAGCGLTMRSEHLAGLLEFAAELVAGGGPNALGIGGDDDALVSAYLWKRGLTIAHVATGNIFAAPGSRATSQTAALAARGQHPDAQKLALKKLTGWPWFVENGVGRANVVRRA